MQSQDQIFLEESTGTEDHLRRVERFVNRWSEPLTPRCGVSCEELGKQEERLGCSFPPALRDWYFLGGQRTDLWAGLRPVCRLMPTNIFGYDMTFFMAG